MSTVIAKVATINKTGVLWVCVFIFDSFLANFSRSCFLYSAYGRLWNWSRNCALPWRGFASTGLGSLPALFVDKGWRAKWHCIERTVRRFLFRSGNADATAFSPDMRCSRPTGVEPGRSTGGWNFDLGQTEPSAIKGSSPLWVLHNHATMLYLAEWDSISTCWDRRYDGFLLATPLHQFPGALCQAA